VRPSDHFSTHLSGSEALLIYEPPQLPDDVIRAADSIMLVDPDQPGWEHPLFVRFILRPSDTLEISVDSSDRIAIQHWHDRIRELNLDD